LSDKDLWNVLQINKFHWLQKYLACVRQLWRGYRGVRHGWATTIEYCYQQIIFTFSSLIYRWCKCVWCWASVVAVVVCNTIKCNGRSKYFNCYRGVREDWVVKRQCLCRWVTAYTWGYQWKLRSTNITFELRVTANESSRQYVALNRFSELGRVEY